MNDVPTQTFTTMCPMNCHPTQCGMVVEVKDGELVTIRGDKDHPDSRGFLCVRGQAAHQIIGNSKRLLTPLIRDRRGEDTSWKRASWNEALTMIAERMEQAGRNASALWGGHGNAANNYGTFVGGQLLARFAHLSGCQNWNGAMICWGLGGFGAGLTGALETNTKEDMGKNAELIIMWGANLVSQPNTAPHIAAAKRRGARIITIDVRRTETAVQSDEYFQIRPGNDVALALAIMNVLVSENLYDVDFVSKHTVGFSKLCEHVSTLTPEWAASKTGIEAERIVALAHTYASTKPAMIVLGGSSIHKGANGWQAARAISCLPALIGSYGIAGGGLGPRHGTEAHGFGLNNIAASDRRLPGTYIPNQMSEITAALNDGRIKVLLLFGVNMLSSWADSDSITAALDKLDLVVCHELFMNETTRRYADIILPGTAWLEDLGCKATHTHLYLADHILEPAGETRPVHEVLKGLAERLVIEDFYPWKSHEELLDQILDHPSTGGATIASMRANGGMAPFKISHIAHPTREFNTPSGKIEFFSLTAEEAGLPPLPMLETNRKGISASSDEFPLVLCQGRTLTQFHAFYDHGKALPLLAERDPGPELWISPDDAKLRDLADGAALQIFNQRGSFEAKARLTDRVPAGVVWMRDGCSGLNRVTSGAPVLPETALDIFKFSVGQSRYEAMVEVVAA